MYPVVLLEVLPTLVQSIFEAHCGPMNHDRVCDRRDGRVGLNSAPETDCERALVGYRIFSTTAKWRPSPSTRCSVLKTCLTLPTLLEMGILRQSEDELTNSSADNIEKRNFQCCQQHKE